MSDEKLANERKMWSQQDDDLLLLLVERHTPKAAMVPVLQRTERSIVDRLHRHHKAAWNASGHPESSPTPKTSEDTAEALEGMRMAIAEMCHSLGEPSEILERLRSIEVKLDTLLRGASRPTQQMLPRHHAGPENGRAPTPASEPRDS